jgi:hypothetical protein
LRGVTPDIARSPAAAQKQLPEGSSLLTRGQGRRCILRLWHCAGLAFAIVLVYLLVVVNFQSWII